MAKLATELASSLPVPTTPWQSGSLAPPSGLSSSGYSHQRGSAGKAPWFSPVASAPSVMAQGPFRGSTVQIPLWRVSGFLHPVALLEDFKTSPSSLPNFC